MTAAPTALPDLDGLDAAGLKALILVQHEQLLSHRSEIEQLKLLIAKLRRSDRPSVCSQFRMACRPPILGWRAGDKSCPPIDQTTARITCAVGAILPIHRCNSSGSLASTP